jgi:stage V sporulation protein G
MDQQISEMADRTSVQFTVSNARRIEGKTVFAMVDLEVGISGVVFSVFGVQAKRLPGGGTGIALPTFKDADGSWKPALQMPDEVRRPLAEAVLAFLMEEGLAQPRFKIPVSSA